jgi:acyl-coenzyme A thioesterase PaaI-like protein
LKQRLAADFGAVPIPCPLAAMAAIYPATEQHVAEHFLFSSMHPRRTALDMMYGSGSDRGAAAAGGVPAASKPTLWTFVHFRAGQALGNSQGCVHGGVLAACFDGALGMLFTLSGRPGFTASLTVDYRKPVPIPARLLLRSTIDRVEGRKIYISGQLTDAGAVDGDGRGGGALYAESTSLFLGRKEGELGG